MPSAEKSTSAATKLEIAPSIESKVVENLQKENASEQNEKSVPANSIQQVISIISNKVRNLEKRKNKLDGYIKEEESGKELSLEQQKAVSKYDEVVQQLSLSKEFCKQFQGIASAATKDAKREARKTMFARQMQETTKVRDVLMIEDLLNRLKVDSIRSDFLNQRHGACSVEKTELEFIDKFAQHVTPLRPNFSNEPSFESAAKTSAEHFSNLIDGRTRPFLDTGMTYEKAKELFNRIQSCSYWEKDVKFVEVTEESRAENDTPNMDDLEAKERSEEIVEASPLPVAAPAPTQVPTPTFNGNVNVLPVQPQMMARIQQQPLPEAPTNVPLNMKTTVTAVENAYFNQLKYSQPQQPPQGQLIANGQLPIVASQNDFGNNFSFLQDSELDSPLTGSQQQQQQQQQQKMPVNMIQSKSQHRKQQQQQQQLPQQQTFKHASNFHPQSPIAAQMYPPGLKVQQQQQLPNSVPHIPVNYQANPQQQLNTVPTQVPSHMIPKQQQPVNGNQTQVSGYGTQTPPMPQQQPQQQASRPQAAYPPMVPPAQQQYQQQQQQLPQNLPAEQKSVKLDGSGDAGVVKEKEKPRDDYQQQPQIDTWSNETAAQTGGGNNFQPRSSGGSGFTRGNRSSGGQGGAKYNNYRNSQQQPRNFENGNGDSSSPRDGAPFFRNNERYNGSPAGAARFENRGGGSGGNFKGREGNYRAGSGRFAGSASAAAAQGSSNPGQRK